MSDATYEFTAAMWLYDGEQGSWHFLTLPPELSDEIAEGPGESRPGFGSVPVEVTIGGTTWETSIFPSKKHGSYVLPIKAEVRKREDFGEGDEVAVRLAIR